MGGSRKERQRGSGTKICVSFTHTGSCTFLNRRQTDSETVRGTDRNCLHFSQLFTRPTVGETHTHTHTHKHTHSSPSLFVFSRKELSWGVSRNCLGLCCLCRCLYVIMHHWPLTSLDGALIWIETLNQPFTFLWQKELLLMLNLSFIELRDMAKISCYDFFHGRITIWILSQFFSFSYRFRLFNKLQQIQNHSFVSEHMIGLCLVPGSSKMILFWFEIW